MKDGVGDKRRGRGRRKVIDERRERAEAICDRRRDRRRWRDSQQWMEDRDKERKKTWGDGSIRVRRGERERVMKGAVIETSV